MGRFPLCNYNIGSNRINVKPYFDFFAGLCAEGHHSRDKDQAGCAHNEVKEDILEHFKTLLGKKLYVVDEQSIFWVLPIFLQFISVVYSSITIIKRCDVFYLRGVISPVLYNINFHVLRSLSLCYALNIVCAGSNVNRKIKKNAPRPKPQGRLLDIVLILHISD